MNNTHLNEAGNTENGLSIAGQVQPLVIRWQPHWKPYNENVQRETRQEGL